MKCLILDCGKEAKKFFRVKETTPSAVSSTYITAACRKCSKLVPGSVVDDEGGPCVVEIGYDEFLVSEVMESEPVLRATMELGNGRLVYDE